MHHGACITHVPWCIPGLLTSGFFWSRWRGKRSRHSRRMHDPKFNISGKRPIINHGWSCVIHCQTIVSYTENSKRLCWNMLGDGVLPKCWRARKRTLKTILCVIKPLEKNTICPMLKQQNTHHNSPVVRQSVVTCNEMIVSIYANDGIYEINTYLHYQVSATNNVIRISEINKIILTVRFRLLKKPTPYTRRLAVQSIPIPRRWCLPIMVNISTDFTIFDDLSWLDTPYNLVCVGAVVIDWREAWQVGSLTNGRTPDKVNWAFQGGDL